MNAKIAANNVYHYREKHGPGRCGFILKNIEKLSEDGVDSFRLSVKLEDQEREHLESLGFSVTTSHYVSGFLGRNVEYTTTITW